MLVRNSQIPCEPHAGTVLYHILLLYVAEAGAGSSLWCCKLSNYPVVYCKKKMEC
jgi:hypothetical protein